MTLEQAMAELEAIVERVEGGEVGLEEALKEYEKGVALHARCRKILERIEVRVEELGKLAGSSASSQAQPQTEPPDEEAPF